MSLGEVDTLNLLSDKLNNLFDESQDYYESFLDANNMYKQGKLTDKEFFQKLGDYVVAYSALEFLSIKVIFELKKSIDKLAGGSAVGGTQSPGLMPGMGTPGMMPGGMPATRPGTAQNPVGGPASVISAGGGFSDAGTYLLQIHHLYPNNLVENVLRVVLIYDQMQNFVLIVATKHNFCR